MSATEKHSLRQEQASHPREFPNFTYAYPVLSRRAQGISIGVNLNIDKHCNFDCPYCQVDRTVSRPGQAIDVDTVTYEVESLLAQTDKHGVCRLPKFASLPDDRKILKDVAISGDGEPTMVPEFPEVCTRLAALQAARPDMEFNLILITNASLLDRAGVQKGIASLLSRNGEVWAKLDAGTEAWYQKVNVSRISLDRIEENLKLLGRSHPYRIQSMFCALDGDSPSAAEQNAFLERLQRIKAAGSRILDVQLYTLARKSAQASCTPVTAAFLDILRLRIVSETGLPARVYGLED